MNRKLAAQEILKLAKEILSRGKFYIEFYSNGKRKRKYYDTQEEAEKVAGEIFKKTGIVVGIQEK